MYINNLAQFVLQLAIPRA